MFFSGHNPLASVPQTNPHVSIIEAYCWVYQYATILGWCFWDYRNMVVVFRRGCFSFDMCSTFWGCVNNLMEDCWFHPCSLKATPVYSYHNIGWFDIAQQNAAARSFAWKNRWQLWIVPLPFSNLDCTLKVLIDLSKSPPFEQQTPANRQPKITCTPFPRRKTYLSMFFSTQSFANHCKSWRGYPRCTQHGYIPSELKLVSWSHLRPPVSWQPFPPLLGHFLIFSHDAAMPENELVRSSYSSCTSQYHHYIHWLQRITVWSIWSPLINHFYHHLHPYDSSV